MTSRSASNLAFTHLMQSLLVGLLLLPVLDLVVMFSNNWAEWWPMLQAHEWQVLLLAMFVAVAYICGSVVLGSIFLGLPAAIAGLLRVPFMTMLLTACRNRPPGRAHALMLTGTLLLFEVPVLVVAFLSPTPFLPILSNIPGFFLKINLLSAPWLVSSLYISYQIMRQEAGPIMQIGTHFEN